jgi:hypothetical protein
MVPFGYPLAVRLFAALVVITTAVVVGQAHDAAEAAPAPSFTETVVASVASPTAIESLPGGRVVVLEQDTGRVRLIDVVAGRLLGTPAAQLAVCAGGVRGLLGFGTVALTDRVRLVTCPGDSSSPC